jgi:hypothetical protein
MAIELKNYLQGPVTETTDITTFIEAAENAAISMKESDILFPGGKFSARRMVLKNGLRWVGKNRETTMMKPLAANWDGKGFVQMAPGPVVYAGISNMTFAGGAQSATGAINPGQYAWELIAALPPAGSTQHGGLWNCTFERVKLTNWDRYIKLQGTITTDYNLPHQYNTFRDIDIHGWTFKPGPALHFIGQVNQGLYNNVRINGVNLGFLLEHAPDLAQVSPKVHQFNVLTVEDCAQVGIIRGAHLINFDTDWFEKTDHGIVVERDSFNITIQGSRFSNVGRLSAAIKFIGNATGTVEDNSFQGGQLTNARDYANPANVRDEGNTLEWGAMDPAEPS